MLESSDNLRRKVVYIPEFLVHEYGLAAALKEDTRSNEFVEELNRGCHCVPSLGIVFFGHCAINLYGKVKEQKIKLQKLCSYTIFSYQLTYGTKQNGMSHSEKYFLGRMH